MSKNQFSGFCLLLSVLLAACNLPAQAVVQSTPNTTEIYATVSNNINQAVLSSASAAALPPQTSSTPALIQPTKTPAMVVSFTPPPTATLPCNRASAGRPLDVTIPDNTEFNPGETFSKTWRLVNTGGCAWSKDYALVWFSGDSLGASRSETLNGNTAPGQSMDISVDMVAPEEAGTYQSNWKLSSPEGQLFGIGPNGDAPVWVRINVIAIATATATPTPTSTATLSPLSTGSVTLTVGNSIDLDSGQNNSGNPDDLLFKQNDDGSFALQPINNARLGVGDQPENCQTSAVQSDPAGINESSSNAVYCYRTNQGLPGFLRISQLDVTAKTLSFNFTTWNIP